MTRVQHTCHAIWVPLRPGLLHPDASTPSRPAGPTCSASTRSPCPKGLIAFGSMFWLLHVRYPLRPSDRLQCVLAPNGRSERYSQYALLSAITPLKHGLLMYVHRAVPPEAWFCAARWATWHQWAGLGLQCGCCWVSTDGASAKLTASIQYAYALLSAITPLKHGLLMYVTHVRLIIVSKYFIFQCFAIM